MSSEDDSTSDTDDDVNRNWNRTSEYKKKFDIQVPDRIMDRGQDQHVGTKALPRELKLQGKDAMINDPSMIRILTPPRTITLQDQPKHNYRNKNEKKKHESDDDMPVAQNSRARLSSKMPNVMSYGNIGDGLLETSNDLGDRNPAQEASGFYEAEIEDVAVLSEQYSDKDATFAEEMSKPLPRIPVCTIPWYGKPRNFQR